MCDDVREQLESITEYFETDKCIVILTGAGISADSGVPTYRGIGGLYEIDVTEDGPPIEQILSGPTLRSNPELTWKYLGQIAKLGVPRDDLQLSKSRERFCRLAQTDCLLGPF